MTVIEAEEGAVAVGAIRQVGENQELAETDYEQRTPRQESNAPTRRIKKSSQLVDTKCLLPL
eukprot:scaffold27784_cov76-Amphora_coffeaeformis.AAC.1